jgi:addiction module RelB/DinJ family antitoxin
MQTTVIFKTDKKLKEAAQKTAKTMGIPFSAVMNEYMRDFVEKKTITFSTEQYNPTPYLRKILDQGEKDLAVNKNIKTFDNLEDLFADLNA